MYLHLAYLYYKYECETSRARVLKQYLSTSRRSLNETHVRSQLDKLTSTLSARLTKQFTSTRVCGFSA